MSNWNLQTWKDNLLAKLLRRPQNREQLIDTFRAAEEEHIVDSDVQEMLEGVLQVSQMQVRDIMVPRSQMVDIFADYSLQQVIRTIVESQHSRYPVLVPDTYNVLGILLAKDILRFPLSMSLGFRKFSKIFVIVRVVWF